MPGRSATASCSTGLRKTGSTGQRTVPGNHPGGEAVPVAQPHHSRAFVNAGGHSGETAFRALNTVNWGSELQRDIHAVPGNIDMPGNSGCNRLIQEQRATIVCSVADMDDVWHAPHPPESFHDVATQRKDGSDCDVGTPRDAGILRDSSPSGGNRSSAMTESQRAIIDAIRWCRRRRIAPTAQSVAEQLRTRSGEKGLETGATEGGQRKEVNGRKGSGCGAGTRHA